MKKRALIIFGLVVGVIGWSSVYYFDNNKNIKLSIVKKDEYINVKYYDLVTEGLDLKTYAVPLIENGDKYSTYGTSMDFNGFDFKIISDKYTDKIKEIDIEINKEDGQDGVTNLMFFINFRDKVLKYLGVDDCSNINFYESDNISNGCRMLSKLEDDKFKCKITKEGD